MKKLITLCAITCLLASCHFLIVRDLAPTLVVKGAGTVINAPQIGVRDKSLGLSEVAFYETGQMSMTFKAGLIDTTLIFELKRDSLIRIDIEGQKIIKTQHGRF